MDILDKLGVGGVTDFTPMIQLFILMTLFMFLPTVLFMMTSFTRIIICFSFLKSGLGVTQNIPNQVLAGLAMVVTLFVMSPVISEINKVAIEPLTKGEIQVTQALKVGQNPIREFMLAQTRDDDLSLFMDNSGVVSEYVTRENVPLYILVPAFAISELKTAFQIGFLLFIPFLVIDLVVASSLQAMNMFMLPPVSISLPIKLYIFVYINGWNVFIESLISSFS